MRVCFSRPLISALRTDLYPAPPFWPFHISVTGMFDPVSFFLEERLLTLLSLQRNPFRTSSPRALGDYREDEVTVVRSMYFWNADEAHVLSGTRGRVCEREIRGREESGQPRYRKTANGPLIAT